MGGFFGVASKSDCIFDLFFGVDYHSHLGTKRGGMAVYSPELGFNRQIHNIENSPFRTKFEKDGKMVVKKGDTTLQTNYYKQDGKNIYVSDTEDVKTDSFFQVLNKYVSFR